MVAFKEEFPYLRADSGQLFEFNRDWLHDAITQAADRAGYPSWWLTEHVTESITFYLRLRTDESVVAFSQLNQTVRYVLKVIGYKEIVPHFRPTPPPISVSLFEIAEAAGDGYELAFFDLLEKRVAALSATGATSLHFFGLQPAIKLLCSAKTWTRGCDAMRGEVACFIREKVFHESDAPADRSCSIR